MIALPGHCRPGPGEWNWSARLKVTGMPITQDLHTLSLLRRGHRLASPAAQLEVLQNLGPKKPFEVSLAEICDGPLRASTIDVLQIDVGKLCNQTCRHCHVDAGPDRFVPD